MGFVVKSSSLVIICYGNDGLKMDANQAAIRQKFLDNNAEPDMDFNIFHAEKLEISDLISACNSMPFFGNKRLVELHDADKLLAHDAKEIIEYFSNPNDFCLLAIYGKGLQKNSLLVNEVKKFFGPDALISCTGLAPWDFSKKIVEIARKYGFELVESVAKEVFNRVGENTKHIDAIFQQFALMFSSEEHSSGINIDRNFIIDNIKKLEYSKPWDFTEAVSRKKLGLALKTFNDFPKESVNILYVMLIERFKDLLCVKTCIEEGKQSQIKSRLENLSKQKARLDKSLNPTNTKKPKNFNPRSISNYLDWCVNFSKEELLRDIIMLINLDADFKSGKIDNFSEAFKIELVNICSTQI